MLSINHSPSSFAQYAGIPIRGVGPWDPKNPPDTFKKGPRRRPISPTERVRPGNSWILRGNIHELPFKEQAAQLKPAVLELCREGKVQKIFWDTGTITYGFLPVRDGVEVTWRDPSTGARHKALVHSKTGDIAFVTPDGFKKPDNIVKATQAVQDAVFTILL